MAWSLVALRDHLRRRSGRQSPFPQQDDLVEFVCNLCDAFNRVAPAQLGREIRSCVRCGSTVRFRSIGHLVVREVLGVEQSIAEAAESFHVAGIGLSDSETYALPLARRFSYTNTFFDAEPRLDITAVPAHHAERYDFVIASDVFEHVTQPVARAFDGVRRLLRAGGVLIMTVPFSQEPDTLEHFPELHDFSIVDTQEGKRLRNVTLDGRTQFFDNLIFHGGIGATLEMRVFSRAALERELRSAGFSSVRFVDDACPRFGIVRPEPSGLPIVARP
ncbi:MAG TPA: class I SAM-dependent methyltransferase [Casimicrobiaceae bacterium]|nr:class I SAM-dependent methyltransferase [Casimicrobiaceae bacterium]